MSTDEEDDHDADARAIGRLNEFVARHATSCGMRPSLFGDDGPRHPSLFAHCAACGAREQVSVGTPTAVRRLLMADRARRVDRTTGKPSIIRNLDDLSLEPTPHTVTMWDGVDHKWNHYRDVADLLTDTGRVATCWLPNVYGYVFAETGRLARVIVEAVDNRSPPLSHVLSFSLRKANRKRARWEKPFVSYERYFPWDLILIAWGAWEVPLSHVGPPVLHDAARLAHWQAVATAVRQVAGRSLWLDTSCACHPAPTQAWHDARATIGADGCIHVSSVFGRKADVAP